MAKQRCTCIFLVVVLASLFATSAEAQQPPLTPKTPPAADAAKSSDEVVLVKPNDPSSPKKALPAAEDPAIKSFFFTQDEMTAVHKALNIYLRSLSNKHDTDEGEDFLKQLEGKDKPLHVEAPKKTYTYPQFFLESLAYHSPTDWFIEVNGQRINQDTKVENAARLRVIDIDKDKVSIGWKLSPEDMMKIRPRNKVQDELVNFDSASGRIIFTLHTNQTFSSYAMKVLEGKVHPVTVKNADDANPTQDDKKDEPPAPDQPDNKPKNRPPINTNGPKGLTPPRRNTP